MLASPFLPLNWKLCFCRWKCCSDWLPYMISRSTRMMLGHVLWSNEHNSFLLRKVTFEPFILFKVLALAWEEEIRLEGLANLHSSSAFYQFNQITVSMLESDCFSNKISVLFQPQTKVFSPTSLWICHF